MRDSFRFVSVNGIDIACRSEGPSEAPVVILAHGLMTSHRIWDGVADKLVSDWRLLRYDLRGHGESGTTPGPYSISQMAQDLIGVMDALGVPKAHFIGLSLGGMIGQHLGALFHSRLHTLTLANTCAVQTAGAAWQQRIDTASSQGLEPLVQASLPLWFTPSAFSAQPHLVDHIACMARATPVEGFLGGAAAVRDLAQRELLASIPLPALVIAGEQDRATPLSDARMLVDEIPDAQLVVLPAAHQSAVECPGAFATAWRAFQREIAGRDLRGLAA